MKKMLIVLLFVAGCVFASQSILTDADWGYLNYISPEQYQSCYVDQG